MRAARVLGSGAAAHVVAKTGGAVCLEAFGPLQLSDTCYEHSGMCRMEYGPLEAPLDFSLDGSGTLT